jgi:hypothetical protein
MPGIVPLRRLSCQSFLLGRVGGGVAPAASCQGESPATRASPRAAPGHPTTKPSYFFAPIPIKSESLNHTPSVGCSSLSR